MNNNSKKTSVTVGIPAFNEEANIQNIIGCILEQVQDTFNLETIIISSDGSTDQTVKLVKELNNPLITLLDHTIRQGLADNQNSILEKSESEILVLIQADTVIKDPHFIEKIIKPIVENKADLTSCLLTALPPQSYFEKCLYVSMLCKNDIFDKYKDGDNIYTCHGPARAFSKKFYKVIRFPQSVGEDAFTYLFCKYKGFCYQYVKNTEIFYKLPNNFKDHEKQSIRLFHSQTLFTSQFDAKNIHDEYTLPRLASIIIIAAYFFRYPREMFVYIICLSYLRIKSLFSRNVTETWDISTSSKNL